MATQDDHKGLWRLMKRTHLNQVSWIQDRMFKDDAEAEWKYLSDKDTDSSFWIEPDVAVAGRFD